MVERLTAVTRSAPVIPRNRVLMLQYSQKKVEADLGKGDADAGVGAGADEFDEDEYDSGGAGRTNEFAMSP